MIINQDLFKLTLSEILAAVEPTITVAEIVSGRFEKTNEWLFLTSTDIPNPPFPNCHLRRLVSIPLATIVSTLTPINMIQIESVEYDDAAKVLTILKKRGT